MICLPPVRQYLEVFGVKFCLMYPDVTLTDPEFFKTLLDTNMKPAVAGTMLIISGSVLINKLETKDAVSFKRRIFEHILGFCTANSAHVRCIA
jgi:hypothetical protein